MAHRLISDLVQTAPPNFMSRTSVALVLLTLSAWFTPTASAQPPVWIQPVTPPDLATVSGVGAADGAWTFSQNFDRIENSSSAEFTIADFPAGSMTVQLDLRVDNTSADRGGWVSVLHRGANDNQRTPSLWLAPGNEFLYFSFSTGPENTAGGRSNRTLRQGEWVEVTYTLDTVANEARLYLDGLFQQTVEIPPGSLQSNNGPFHLGGDGTYSSFQGALKNVRIYDRVLQPTLPARFTFDQGLHSEAGLNGFRFRGTPYGSQATAESLQSQNRLDLNSSDQGLRVEGLPSASGLILSFRLFLEEAPPANVFHAVLHKGARDLQRAPGIFLDSNRTLYVATSTSTSGNEFQASGQPIELETWTDITLVLDPLAGDSGQMRLYIDGALDSTLALAGTVQGNGEDLYVGTSPWHDGFVGQLDDLVIQPLLNTIRRQTLAGATNHAFYYGDPDADALTQLGTYDLVFIEAAHYTAAEIQTLQDNNTLVIAYVSFGEQAMERRTAAHAIVTDRYDWDVPLGKIEATNPRWCSFYVNPTANWQSYVTEYLMSSPINELEVDGIFMDTLDTADLYATFGLDQEAFQGRYIELISAAKGAFPEHLLFANRGFSLMSGIRSSVDGVVFESFTQDVMLNADGTVNATDNDTVWANNRVTEDLVPARDRDGVRLLSLDYCGGAGQPAADVCQQRAVEQGLLPYITTNSDLLTVPPAIVAPPANNP